MNLFNHGQFQLHSGGISNFKIDCDALTDADLEALAKLVSGKITFGYVYGIPTGGERFAEKLKKYIDPGDSTMLIVDDVMTTGNSIDAAYDKLMKEYDYIEGVVIFDRSTTDIPWIYSIFKANV